MKALESGQEPNNHKSEKNQSLIAQGLRLFFQGRLNDFQTDSVSKSGINSVLIVVNASKPHELIEVFLVKKKSCAFLYNETIILKTPFAFSNGCV